MLTVRGKNCNNDVVPGTNRCYIHGGAAPATLLKAQVQLAALRNPAIDILFNSIIALDQTMEKLQSVQCAACGFPELDTKSTEALIKAAAAAGKTCSMILDRTGLGPRATLEIKQSDGDLDWDHLLVSEQEELLALMTQWEDLKRRIHERLLGQLQPVNTIDGEVLETDSE